MGGLISFVSGLAYSMMVTRRAETTAGEALRTLIRAEALKIGLIVILLWLVLSIYSSINFIAFFACFIANTCVFSMAFFIRD